MNPIFYKVIFRAIDEDNETTISLTFRSLIHPKPIKFPSDLLSTLKSLDKNDIDIINFQNIQEVIKIDDTGVNYSFNYYLVLLFTYIEDNKKEALLIGNVKKLGDILLGFWPFYKEELDNNKSKIEEIFELLIKKDVMKKICIIHS